MVAVRNLLASMLEDAQVPEARDHLQRMIDFAASAPQTQADPHMDQTKSRSDTIGDM